MLPIQASTTRPTAHYDRPTKGSLPVGQKQHPPPGRAVRGRIKERNNPENPETERRLWTIVDHVRETRGRATSPRPSQASETARQGRTGPRRPTVPATRQPTGGTSSAARRGRAPARSGPGSPRSAAERAVRRYSTTRLRRLSLSSNATRYLKARRGPTSGQGTR